jgi:hypothetical protein
MLCVIDISTLNKTYLIFDLLTIFVFHFIVRAQRVDYFVFITLLINALLYPSRVDGIKQTCRHGYIYMYKHEHTNQ